MSADQTCRYFQRRHCTACTRLDVPYGEQLAAKEAAVRQALAGALAAGGGVVLPVAPSPEPMAYRTSVKLCLHRGRDGQEAIGLYRAGTKEVAHIPGCPTQVAAATALTAQLFAEGVRRPAPFYNHRDRSFQKGRLKFLTLRIAPAAPAVIIAHTGVPAPLLREWLASAGTRDLCAYESRLTPYDGDLPVGRDVAHLSGPEVVPVTLAGRVFDLAPAAFFQANYSLSEGLIRGATAFLQDGDVLLDLYGGCGAYSFAAAPRFRRAMVVDGNGAAIDAARRAAAALPPPPPMGRKFNLEAFAATCEAFLTRQLKDEMARRVTHGIVNPPRGGLSRQVIDELGKRRLPALRELHYVSCNPVTLARDLELLRPLGFALREAQPFDMFPQTNHVEVVARLASISVDQAVTP
jgi:23S rRNA (uracil1939-C5)-methyltransferase